MSIKKKGQNVADYMLLTVSVPIEVILLAEECYD